MNKCEKQCMVRNEGCEGDDLVVSEDVFKEMYHLLVEIDCLINKPFISTIPPYYNSKIKMTLKKARRKQ